MACNLEPSHVLALRLYSTAVYKSINGPLRDTKRTGPHPLAITVSFVDEGVRRLRAIGADGSGAIAQCRCKSCGNGGCCGHQFGHSGQVLCCRAALVTHAR